MSEVLCSFNFIQFIREYLKTTLLFRAAASCAFVI